MDVDREIKLLLEELQRFGGRVKFGVLCRDDRCSNLFEALGGTLKAAKKRKLVGYDSELLLQGAHDDVEIYLVEPAAGGLAPPSAAADPAVEPAADTGAETIAAADAAAEPAAKHEDRQLAGDAPSNA